MSELNMTYDLLFDVLRYEKSKEELQILDPDFYTNVVEYLQSKESVLIHSQTSAAERELTRLQISNIKKILAELYERREKKIISLAIYKIKTGSGIINMTGLLPQENALFESVFQTLSANRNNIINNVMNSINPDNALVMVSKNSSKNEAVVAEDNSDSIDSIKSVRFVKPVPRFLGPELDNYGPFEQDDIASLPSKVANILIRKERAEEIKIN